MATYKIENQKLWREVTKKDGTVEWVEDLNVPDSVKGELEEDVRELQDFKEEQQDVIPDTVIKGIAEIQNFLEGISDKEKLTELFSNLQAAIAQALSNKQDTISDLSTIRSNATAGKQASALVGDTVLIGIRATANGTLIGRYRTNQQSNK